MKHAEQFENNQLGFMWFFSTDMVIPYAYDQQDEIEAALQANLFDPNSSSDYQSVRKITRLIQSEYGCLSRYAIKITKI
ncbi:MAG: hypothetical protein J5848_07115 [Bacteroidales bacterium]|nr:hypothetical protein [Bacteroidales bacterium]